MIQNIIVGIIGIVVFLYVIKKIIDFAFETGLNVLNISFSPIKGPEGNIEYLIYLDRKKAGLSKEEAYALADETADTSHNEL